MRLIASALTTSCLICLACVGQRAGSSVDASATHEDSGVGAASPDAAPNDGPATDLEVTPGDAVSDEASLDEAQDTSADADRTDDASATAPCHPERTTTVPGAAPIEVGAFCDVVFLCVTPEQASRAKSLAPDFECKAAAGEYGCGQQVCELFPSAQSRRLLQGEIDQVCGLSSLDVGAGAIQCRVYL